MLKNLLIVLLLFVASCGFKVVNISENSNFFIKEILTSGDKRINFKIKNNLLINSTSSSSNILLIDLETNKTKNIKEKNIKNEITKYEVTLITKIRVSSINQLIQPFIIDRSLSGDYLVNKNYSTTLSSEKKLVDNLIDEITQKIINDINSKLNDI